MSLPRHLRFDEHNLSSAAFRLSSPVQAVISSAWLFAFMHCVAECGMFQLQSALVNTGERWALQRQNQAIDNIVIIMDAIGERGRSSPLSEARVPSWNKYRSWEIAEHLL